MIRWSASSIERAKACPASALLPDAGGSVTEASRRGTVIHAYLERWRTLGRDQALAGVPEDLRVACAAIDIEALPPNATPEVAFCFDAKSGKARILGKSIGREYGNLAPWEIPGTPDLYAIGDGYAFVGDYKTGRKVAPANENLQLKFYALCAARASGNDACAAEILRIDENGEVYRDAAFFDVIALDEFAAQLFDLADDLMEAARRYQTDGVVKTVEGPHCEHCSAYEACPRKTSLIRSLASGQAPAATATPILTEAHAAQAWHELERLKQLVRRVDRALRGFAERHPIRLGDGKVWGPVVTEGSERIDGDITHAVIAELIGPAVADQAVTRSASKASISRALKSHGFRVATERRKLLAEIRARGGADRKPSKRFEIYPEGNRANSD